MRKIEEVAGMDEDALALEQIEHERFLAADGGHTRDERPSALDRQQVAGRMRAHERPGSPQVVANAPLNRRPGQRRPW